jgi:hypothetical protein
VILSLNTMNRVTEMQFVNSEVGHVFLRVTEVSDSQVFASCLRVVNLSREKESFLTTLSVSLYGRRIKHKYGAPVES